MYYEKYYENGPNTEGANLLLSYFYQEQMSLN